MAAAQNYCSKQQSRLKNIKIRIVYTSVQPHILLKLKQDTYTHIYTTFDLNT